MKRTTIYVALGILCVVASSAVASQLRLDTAHLIVRDSGADLSDERMRQLAHHAQDTLEKVLRFWSADPMIEQLGKIRVIFDEQRRDVYASAFFWRMEAGLRRRVIKVKGSEPEPHMLAHKLTSAVLPQEDKLIRNLMGQLSEMRVGNPLSFPMCGFDGDDWVLALLARKSYIPIAELGPDHESWGMRSSGNGQFEIHDKARQHKAYIEAGSLGTYLLRVYGLDRIKRLHHLAREAKRPWQEAFGVTEQLLESGWLAALRADEKSRAEAVLQLENLIERNPDTACAQAQDVAQRKRHAGPATK